MDSIFEVIAGRITPIGWDILQILSKTEDLSRTEIEKKFQLTSFKGAEQIARLFAAGLIDFSRSDTDFRFKNYKISSYGLEILKYR